MVKKNATFHKYISERLSEMDIMNLLKPLTTIAHLMFGMLYANHNIFVKSFEIQLITVHCEYESTLQASLRKVHLSHQLEYNIVGSLPEQPKPLLFLNVSKLRVTKFVPF